MNDEPIREKPSCVALVICNEVIEDKKTNNKTLVSLFDHIAVGRLPTTHGRLFVMASFTDGRGRWPMTFRITSPSGQVVLRIEGEAVITDPLAVVDVVMEVRDLPLDEQGVYDVDFLFDNEVRAHRRFTVKRFETDQTP